MSLTKEQIETLLNDRKRFIVFAKLKPPEEEYNFCDARNCAMAQYLKAFGAEGDECVVSVCVEVLNRVMAPIWLSSAVGERGAPRTWGKLVERLETVERLGG